MRVNILHVWILTSHWHVDCIVMTVTSEWQHDCIVTTVTSEWQHVWLVPASEHSGRQDECLVAEKEARFTGCLPTGMRCVVAWLGSAHRPLGTWLLWGLSQAVGSPHTGTGHNMAWTGRLMEPLSKTAHKLLTMLWTLLNYVVGADRRACRHQVCHGESDITCAQRLSCQNCGLFMSVHAAGCTLASRADCIANPVCL